MSNKYRFVLVASLLGSLVLAAPAFAQTTSGSQPGRGFGRMGHAGMGMRGNGVFGTVASVNGNTLTVTSKVWPKGTTSTTTPTPTPITYTVDATNAKVTKNGAASTISSIAVGDMVMVQGTVSGSNVTATAINDGMLQRGVFGTVATINGNSLTVTSKMGPKSTATATTYTVDATNAKVTKNGAASTISSIAVGDMVMVQGTVSGSNVTATAINDGMLKGPMKGQNPIIEGNGQPVVAGTVSAINGDTLTVTNKNVTYTVDATSAKITKNGAASTVSSIAVNDSVIVQGTTNGTNVTASSIIDHAAPAGTSTTGTTKQHAGFFGGIGNFFKHLFGF